MEAFRVRSGCAPGFGIFAHLTGFHPAVFALPAGRAPECTGVAVIESNG